MQKVNDRLVFSPSDLNHFLDCEYLTQLDLEVANGRVLDRRRRAEADLLAARGDAHEQSHLARLRQDGLQVVDIVDPGKSGDWVAAAEATRAAMAVGAAVIYQGVLIAEGW